VAVPPVTNRGPDISRGPGIGEVPGDKQVTVTRSKMELSGKLYELRLALLMPTCDSDAHM